MRRRRAVLICPGRGTYNKAELGYLGRHHSDKAELLARLDSIRAAEGQEAVTALDGAKRFTLEKYSRGDVASALIHACALADALSLADDIEVVAVSGNSMGWYTALGVGGALSTENSFRLANTMGRLMQEHLTGGQIVYPVVEEDWRVQPERRAEVLAVVDEIDGRARHVLRLSIDLGGMLVLAGNEAGLAAFEAAVEPAQGRFPMRLANHAAFHTPLMAEVAAMGRARLPVEMFGQPLRPLVDGRGAIWWPRATDCAALHGYTLGQQVTQTYDFAAAVRTLAREFAPDLFIVTGPGTTLGGSVAQALIACNWHGLDSKAAFQEWQGEGPHLISMGREDQRALVTR